MAHMPARIFSAGSTRTGSRWLLASTIAAAVALAPLCSAAPQLGGVEEKREKPKVVISPNAGATKKVAAAAQANRSNAAVTKASAAKAPVKKTVSKSTATKSTAKSTSSATKKSSTSTSSQATNNQSSSSSSGGASSAQASTSVQPLKLLVNLAAGQYFTPEMQAQGVEELLVLYPQNFDAQSMQTAKVSGEKIVAAVKAARGENASGWVMLDYEVPFDQVFYNGKTDPRFAPMLESMVEALKYAKAQLPNCKFTYYDAPNIRYYVANKGWDNMPEWARIQTRDTALDLYLPLAKEMDWLSPCVYDRFDPSKHPVSERAQLTAREAAFRANAVAICDALRDAAGKPNMPIIPSVGVVYDAHGTATPWDPISQEEFRSNQIDPAIAMGADGFFLWSSLEYNAWVASLAWVPTAGEAARSSARDTLTKLLFDNAPPASWSTPAGKAELTQRVSNFVAQYAKWTREAEKVIPRPAASSAMATGSEK